MKSFHVLSTGGKMPSIGLGTWRASSESVKEAVLAALQCGYRHFDTAFAYNNEEGVGDALKLWLDANDVDRNDLFITTKLPVFGNRPEDVERFLRFSLNKLRLDYVDLYLMHFPFAFYCDQYTLQTRKHPDDTIAIDYANDFIATWKEMERQMENGLTKSIGVSNFNEAQLVELCKVARIKPSVLQIELHAYLQQPQLLEKCKQLNVVVTAYSPLGSPGANKHFQDKYNYRIENFPDLLHDEEVREIAEKYNKTNGQVLIKHLLQKGVVVIPKSSNPKRIFENIELDGFHLSMEDVQRLDQLDRGEKGRILNFLFFKGIESHPHYPFIEQLNN